jgi:Cdc6-like AAA superfamily ATPase
MSAESDARRALARLRRALEKVERELDAVHGALNHAEGADFPAAAYDDVRASLHSIDNFIDDEEQRLADKLLHAGGLEPGRIRREG